MKLCRFCQDLSKYQSIESVIVTTTLQSNLHAVSSAGANVCAHTSCCVISCLPTHISSRLTRWQNQKYRPCGTACSVKQHSCQLDDTDMHVQSMLLFNTSIRNHCASIGRTYADCRLPNALLWLFLHMVCISSFLGPRYCRMGPGTAAVGLESFEEYKLLFKCCS